VRQGRLSRALLSGRGEASGVSLARQVLDFYAGLSIAERTEFFRLLARDFGPDQQRLRAVWSDYDKAPTSKNCSGCFVPSSRHGRSYSAA
jgi:malonyl-CoA decarboxylase